MRYLIIILLFPFVMNAQVVDFTLAGSGANLGLNLKEVMFIVDGDGTYTLRYTGSLKAYEVVGEAADFSALYSGDFVQIITTGSDTVILNKDFVSRVYDLGSGARVDCKKSSVSFLTSTSYAGVITSFNPLWPENNTYFASEGGDDATAAKNSPSQPWATNAVFSEDLTKGSVYEFFPGTYTVGDAGSGANWGEYDAAALQSFIPSSDAVVSLKSGVVWRNDSYSEVEGYGIINDQVGAVPFDYEIYGPDAEFSIGYDGEGRFVGAYGNASRIELDLGKATVDAPTAAGLYFNRALFGFSNEYSKIKIGEADLYGEQDFLWISYPDDSYHTLEVGRHYIRHDSINTGGRLGYWMYGSNVSGDVDGQYFSLKSKDIIVDHTGLVGATATASVPANQIARIYNTSGDRGRFNFAYHYFEFDRVRFINQQPSLDQVASTGAGGLYVKAYNGNPEYIHIIPNWLDESYMKLKLNRLDASSGGMPLYMQSATYRDNSTVDIDLGFIEGTETILSLDPIIETNSVINITCERCVSSEGVALGFDGSIDATSTLVISGTFITTAAGQPALVLSNSGAGRIILKDVTVINDGTVAAIQADVAQTVIVSGAYDGDTVIADVDITFTTNEY